MRGMTIKRLKFLCNFFGSAISGDVYRVNNTNLRNNTKLVGDIVQISMESSHSLFLRVDGQVYGYGLNNVGQLGFRDFNFLIKPELIPGLEDIVQVSTGAAHSLCLRADGQVYAFGSNGFGQLGLGDNKNRHKPELIPDLKHIIRVSVGVSYSLCLNEDGQVYAFGHGSFGQLGLGDEEDRNKPELIPDLDDIVEVSASQTHSLCLRADGQVYAFESNGFGKLGLGISDNTMYNTPQLIPDLYEIVQISLGYYHSLCLSKTGEVYGFGTNMSRQLGKTKQRDVYKSRLIPEVSGIIQISADSTKSLFLTVDGQVYTFNSVTGEKEVIPIPDGKSCITSSFSQVIAHGYSYTLMILQ